MAVAVAEWTEHNWLMLAYPDNPTIRVDACFLDRVLAESAELFLAIGDLSVGLKISSGNSRSSELANDLSSYVRSSPLARSEAYDDAKRRREAMRGQPSSYSPMFFGGRALHVKGNKICIGESAYLISDVMYYAERRAAIPLADGKLQAALAMLVVAGEFRTESAAELDDKIQAYETALHHSGRTS